LLKNRFVGLFHRISLYIDHPVSFLFIHFFYQLKFYCFSKFQNIPSSVEIFNFIAALQPTKSVYDNPHMLRYTGPPCMALSGQVASLGFMVNAGSFKAP